MLDYIDIAPTPYDEDCVQVGHQNYRNLAFKECKAFVEAIIKKLGQPPEGARLVIKEFPHDFGNYLTVVCKFDDSNEQATEYAYKCESDSPATWAEVGMEKP